MKNKKITKSYFIEVLMDEGYSRKESELIVDTLLTTIKEGLQNGLKVVLQNVCTLYVDNIRAHEKIVFGKPEIIDDKAKLKLRPAVTLTESLNKNVRKNADSFKEILKSMSAE